MLRLISARRRRVRACAWCGRVWLGRWLPRAQAVDRLGAQRVDAASYGICDTCLAVELEALAALRRAAA